MSFPTAANVNKNAKSNLVRVQFRAVLSRNDVFKNFSNFFSTRAYWRKIFDDKMVQESSKSEKESESEGRKWSKPIMEKRRRERINRSLDELKRLVLEAQNRDSSRYTKLEKADILEMTVRHLRGLRHHQRSMLSASDPHLMLKYRAGYNACVAEVSKCMMGDECADPHVKTQILSHLAGCHRTPEDFNDMALQSSPRIPTGLHYGPAGEHGMEEQRRAYSRDATESRYSQNRTSMSPYMMQTQRVFPSSGAIPLHYVPVLSSDSGSSQGLHALVPSGPSSGLHLRDPLWRPW